MSLYANGVLIADLRVNNVAMNSCYVDGVLVYIRFKDSWDGVDSLTSLGGNPEGFQGIISTSGSSVLTLTNRTENLRSGAVVIDEGVFSGTAECADSNSPDFSIHLRGSAGGLEVGMTRSGVFGGWSPKLAFSPLTGFTNGTVVAPGSAQMTLEGSGFRLRLRQDATSSIGAWMTVE